MMQCKKYRASKKKHTVIMKYMEGNWSIGLGALHNISHKELTYLLQKSTSHQNQALHACS